MNFFVKNDFIYFYYKILFDDFSQEWYSVCSLLKYDIIILNCTPKESSMQILSKVGGKNSNIEIY